MMGKIFPPTTLYTLTLLLLLSLLPQSCSSFPIQLPATFQRRSGPSLSSFRPSSSSLFHSNDAYYSPGKIPKPINEFSRVYHVGRVVSPKRSYRVEIEASESERQALAERFELSNIHQLQAQLALRQETTSDTGVEVEGTVQAHVVQTCVRTGEKFDVDVEFPLYAIVRPVASIWDSPTDPKDENAQLRSELLQSSSFRDDNSGRKNNNSKKHKRRKKDNNTRVKTQAMQQMDISELQQLLEDFEVDNNENLMEDETILSTDQKLDVGELVAQLFWLKLDPYPKKPGSEPIQVSISS